MVADIRLPGIGRPVLGPSPVRGALGSAPAAQLQSFVHGLDAVNSSGVDGPIRQSWRAHVEGCTARQRRPGRQPLRCEHGIEAGNHLPCPLLKPPKTYPALLRPSRSGAEVRQAWCSPPTIRGEHAPAPVVQGPAPAQPLRPVPRGQGRSWWRPSVRLSHSARSRRDVSEEDHLDDRQGAEGYLRHVEVACHRARARQSQ